MNDKNKFIQIDSKAHKQLKIHAAKIEVPLRQLVNNILLDYIESEIDDV